MTRGKVKFDAVLRRIYAAEWWKCGESPNSGAGKLVCGSGACSRSKDRGIAKQCVCFEKTHRFDSRDLRNIEKTH